MGSIELSIERDDFLDTGGYIKKLGDQDEYSVFYIRTKAKLIIKSRDMIIASKVIFNDDGSVIISANSVDEFSTYKPKKKCIRAF